MTTVQPFETGARVFHTDLVLWGTYVEEVEPGLSRVVFDNRPEQSVRVTTIKLRATSD